MGSRPTPPEGSVRVLRAADAAHGPFIVFWELTQACQLACRHCRACAQPLRHPRELDTAEGEALLRSLATFRDGTHAAPIVVLTGGDPLERRDLEHLVRFGTELGLEMALTPSATPLLDRGALARLRAAGLARLALSLDGATAATHDAFRGTAGSFARTLAALEDARALGIPLQVNTTLTRGNQHELEALAELLSPVGLTLWSLFFLVPVGRGAAEERLRADEVEAVFGRIAALEARVPFLVKTTEAPHYRRFRVAADGRDAAVKMSSRAPLGITDGKGTLFVSHVGEVFPTGFLPLRCGDVRQTSIVDIYRTSPVLLSLRDGAALEGKCGVCDFKAICGGSRARAWALTGNPLAEEPDCAYVPPGA